LSKLFDISNLMINVMFESYKWRGSLIPFVFGEKTTVELNRIINQDK